MPVRLSPRVEAQEQPPTSAKLAFLRSPQVYPEPTTAVQVVETHMSWVFLTDTRAYKMKKPVRYAFLDFSTLEARRRDSEAELRLNARLAPGVYLDVVPLVRDPGAGLRLGGEGEAVEWLVRMRRLPADCMLDGLLRRHRVGPRALRVLAGVLARFYAGAAPVILPPARYLHRVQVEIETNRRVLLDPGAGLPYGITELVCSVHQDFMRRAATLLAVRVLRGRLVEGHGDLRPEHVCMSHPPLIIDCLQFNRDLRVLDAAEDLAFLAMECELLGAPWVGEILFAGYTARTGDRPGERLIAFYKSYRAALRARLAVWHLRDHKGAEAQRWRRRARAYLGLSATYIPSFAAGAPSFLLTRKTTYSAIMSRISPNLRWPWIWR